MSFWGGLFYFTSFALLGLSATKNHEDVPIAVVDELRIKQ